MHGLILIGEVFGWVHQLVGSTEVDMYKMSVIGHLFPTLYVVDRHMSIHDRTVCDYRK